MKDVLITHVVNGKFFKDGIEYKIVNSYNSRIVCHEVSDPEKEIQFSSYDKVQVPDEEAKSIKIFLQNVMQRYRVSLHEMETDLQSLELQGV